MPLGQSEAGSERRPAERGRSLEWGRRASVDLGPPRRPLSPVKRARPGQQPKQRPAKRTTARTLGLWALLIFISFAALYSQLRVAGTMGGVRDHGAGQRHGLLKGLAAVKGLQAKQEYRRLHSHEVTVGVEELQCGGRLEPATVRLLKRQLKEERQAAKLHSYLPPPLFLADPGSRHKRCRASPHNSERPPRLHRVALFTPGDAGGLDWVHSAPKRGNRDRDEMRLTQRLRVLLAQQQQQQQAAAHQQPAEPKQQQQQQQQQQQAQPAAGQQQPFAFGSLRLEGAGGEAAATVASYSVLGTGGSKRGMPPADITVVTQLSIDRLPSLRQQCASWSGPTVAVVYAPLVHGLLAGLSGSSDAEVADLEGMDPLDALAYIRRAYADIAGLQDGCSLTLEFVVEERCTEALAGLWPINANRNRALMLAATPAVVLLDVDFLLGGSLSPWLRGRPSAGTSGLADARRLLRATSRAMLDGGRGGSGSSVSSMSSGGGGGSSSSGSSSAADGRSSGSKGGEHEWPSLLTGGAGTRNTSADDAWLAALLAKAEAQRVSWLEAVLSQNAAVVLPAFQTATTRRQLLRGRRIALAAASADKAGVAAMATATPPQIFGFQQDKYPRGHKATRYGWWVQASQPYAIDYWQGYEPFLLMPTARTPFYDERFRGYGWDKHVHTLHAVRQLGMKLVVHPDAWLVHLPHEHSAAQSLSKETGQRAKLHDLFVEARRRILNNRFVPASAYFKQCSPSVAEHPKHLPERHAWLAAGGGKGAGAAELHAAWHQQQAGAMAAAAAELEAEAQQRRQRVGEAASGEAEDTEDDQDADLDEAEGDAAASEEQQEEEQEGEQEAAAAAAGGSGQSAGDEEDEREQAAWTQELEQRMEEEDGEQAADGDDSGEQDDGQQAAEQAADEAQEAQEAEEAEEEEEAARQQPLPRMRFF